MVLTVAAAPFRESPQTTVQIPKSIQAEHHEIHEALVAATKLPGKVGAAAQKLADVLHPHFQREEEIALPPLGLLASLASGQRPSEATASAMLKMTDTLRSEMPRMLEQHKAIRAAVETLRTVATAEKNAPARSLADDLAAHALTEEEILYPAAMLVGDLLRQKR